MRALSKRCRPAGLNPVARRVCPRPECLGARVRRAGAVAADAQCGEIHGRRGSERRADERGLRCGGLRLVRCGDRCLHRGRWAACDGGAGGAGAAAAAAARRFRAGAPPRRASPRAGAARGGGSLGVGGLRMGSAQAARRYAGARVISFGRAAAGGRPGGGCGPHLPAAAGQRGGGCGGRATFGRCTWVAAAARAGRRDCGGHGRVWISAAGYAAGAAGRRRTGAAHRDGPGQYHRLRTPAPRDGRVRRGAARARYPLRVVAVGDQRPRCGRAAVVGNGLPHHVRQTTQRGRRGARSRDPGLRRCRRRAAGVRHLRPRCRRRVQRSHLP